MTVRELSKILTTFSDNMTVKVSYDRFVCGIANVSTVIDIDINFMEE